MECSLPASPVQPFWSSPSSRECGADGTGPQSQLAAAAGSDLKGKLSPVFYTLALAFVRPWIADGLYVLVALL